jgi:large subunit ribosomal protein L13
MTVIDATNLIIGRLAAVAAKRALSGEKIVIVNCEKAVITGTKKFVFERYKHRRQRGGPSKGPFFPTRSDAIMRRTIRGMLPYKQSKGELAWKNIACYASVPDELQKEKLETVANANVSKLSTLKYVQISELARYLGGRI